MSLQLHAGESLPTGLRRIALDQIDTALEYLHTRAPDTETAVHEARKCGKRIRAVLRLVRDEIGYPLYKQENVRVRDAARLLAPVRDSTVMVETLDALLNHFAPVNDSTAPAVDPADFASLRRRLQDRHAQITRQLLQMEKAPAAAAAMLHESRTQVAHWPLHTAGFACIAGGLHRVYRRGRQRLARAYAQPSPEHFHDWRKRVKYLWHQIEVLTPIQPDTLTSLANDLHTLSDYLGDDHDLAELDRLVNAEPYLLPAPEKRKQLFALIARRRRRLQANARPVGGHLYAQKPDAFVQQLADAWHTWRALTPTK